MITAAICQTTSSPMQASSGARREMIARGIMAAALAAVQYLPQIWTTYHLKHVGSLSIPMMCIQTPGGFVFAGSLFARLGWGGWSSWGIFVLTAIMQGILLTLGIYYEIQNREAERAESAARLGSPPYSDEQRDDALIGGDTPVEILDREEDDDAATENAPLLKQGRNGAAHRNYDTNSR